MGLIAIHVDDLLISGSDTFLEYITSRMKGKFEVDTFEENKATYIGMEIEKVDALDFKGVILDSNNYEDKINHIEIPQSRSKQKGRFPYRGRTIGNEIRDVEINVACANYKAGCDLRCVRGRAKFC